MLLVAFLSGAIFSLGLGISGMTQPEKVIGFLDVTGAWDPSLMFVMMGAVVVYFVSYRMVRGHAPVLAGEMHLPGKRDVDARLILGSAIFGVGWGLAGFCPGPALTSLAGGTPQVLLFVAAMITGMYAHAAIERTLGRPAPAVGR